MKNLNKIVLLATISILAACSQGSVRDSLGMRKSVPDEFKVVSNPPLSLPPDFYLRPPAPGAERLGSSEIDKQAQKVVFEKVSAEFGADEKTTHAEEYILALSDAQSADPDIKDVLRKEEEEQRSAESEKGFFSKVLGKDEPKSDPVVNAKKERERMASNTQDGKDITTGETPVIEEKKGGLLNRVFGF